MLKLAPWKYLELPAPLMPVAKALRNDVLLWNKGNSTNLQLDVARFAVGDKGNKRTG